MLSMEDNEILTRVGPGTPMGDLLRRYWIPACLNSEAAEPDGPPARVRLLGEDLVAFRDISGRGAVPRTYTRENDYQIDRVAQKGTSYSGIRDFRSQDAMATETAGPVYDRTKEHLGSTDVALIRMHRQLLRAAKGLSGYPRRRCRASARMASPSASLRRSFT
jgi:hypothetical protein